MFKKIIANWYIRRASNVMGKSDDESDQDFKKALALLDKAERLWPQSKEIFFHQGWLYFCLEEYERSIEKYDNAINLDPLLIDAYYHRGNSYREIDKLKEALRDYNKAIELCPTLKEAINDRERVMLLLRGRLLKHTQENNDEKRSNLISYYLGIFTRLKPLNPKSAFSSSNPTEDAVEAVYKGWNITMVSLPMAMLLENYEDLNIGICPMCGITPIGKDNHWKYFWGMVYPKIKVNLCESCYIKDSIVKTRF